MKYIGIILLCLLILFMLYINTIIVEGSDTGPSLPSGANQASITSIDDMRTLLEQMYMICILNPNDQTGQILNTNSYKISLLGTYLWPLLGPYTSWTIEELIPLFGNPVKPTSQVQKISSQSNPQPPKIPIIANDEDYVKFLQLAVLGSMIMPFSTYPYNNGQSVTLWSKNDRGNIMDYWRYGRDSNPVNGWGHAVYFSSMYLTEITLLLSHFHGQTVSTVSEFPGDNIYTELY